MDIKNKIVDELIDLDLPLNGIMFEYWTELLQAEYKHKFETANMMEKYIYLAVNHNSSIASVERGLLRGTREMEKRIREKYAIKTKITNETIVILFKLKIF